MDGAPQSTPAPFDSEALVASLPNLPGVYRMLGAQGNVLYVGKARDLKKRVSSYFQKSLLSPRIAMMVSQVAKVEVTITRSEVEALVLENNLIKSLTPRYNILFRDDKSYPFLMLSDGPFPRLGFHRGVMEKNRRYFGPYPHTGAVRESIQLLQRVFRLRTCEDSTFQNRSRPCLLFQIKRCSGPCVGLITPDEYSKDVKHATLFMDGRSDEVLREIEERMLTASDAMLYEQAAICRDQVQALGRLAQKQYADVGGDQDVDVIAVAQEGSAFCVNLVMIRGGRQLGDRCLFPQNTHGRQGYEILLAFLLQHYADYPAPDVLVLDGEGDFSEAGAMIAERLGKPPTLVTRPIGDRRAWLDMARENAARALKIKLMEAHGEQARLEALREKLGLPYSAHRIECFDISHISGEAAVASCVIYDRNEMRKSEYRRFNIDGITPGDDYAAMRQALTRRYSKLTEGNVVSPDLILIDGGKGQLAIAKAVLDELGIVDIELAGVAKGVERRPGLEEIWRPGDNEPLILGADHPALLLIQTIRDEAHRFAVAGHRARRSKRRLESNLDGIEGVGDKRRRQLLVRFGGIKGVMGASVEDLSQVQGISRKLAQRIYGALHAS
jgi:excinuclease ABC subunit C